MRVALLSPLKFDPSRYRRFLHDRPPESVGPPMSLAYLAAALEQRGHEVCVIDACRMDLLGLERSLKAFSPQTLGFTSLSDERAYCFQLLRWARSLFPKARFVLGGIHATLMDEQVLRNFPVDVVVLGEGEETLPELVEAWEADAGLEEVRGIAFLRDGAVVRTPCRPLIPDLDSLPFPAYHLVEVGAYRAWNDPIVPFLHIRGMKVNEDERRGFVLTSRGCPGRCSFCSTWWVWGHRYRMRSATNVVDELEMLHRRYACTQFFFIDDIFSVDQQRVIAICDEILHRNLKLLWAFQTRVDFVSQEMLSNAAQAGCIAISYGVESSSEAILKGVRKNIHVEQTVAAFELTRAVGISTGAYLMIGNPGETERSIDETIALLKTLQPDLLIPQITIVQPGTELYKRAAQEGFIDDDYWLTDLPAPYYIYENDLRKLLRWHRKLFDFPYSGPKRMIRTLRDAFELRTGIRVTRRGICRGVAVPPIRQIRWKDEIACPTGTDGC